MKIDVETSRELQKRRMSPDSIRRIERERSKKVVQMLPKMQFGRALDIGCGLGVMLGELKKITVQAVGIDIVNNTKNKDILLCDLNKGYLPFKDTTFDLIVCTEVLEHLHYPHKVLSEMRRILSNNGIAVIGLPNAYNIYDRRNLIFGRRIDAHGFDSYGHQCFTTIEQNAEFVRTQFNILKKDYMWIDFGIIGRVAKIWKNPNLFAQSIVMLCSKKHD